MIARQQGYAAYAGIGSRETPQDVLQLMRALGARLGALGYTLRSGGAMRIAAAAGVPVWNLKLAEHREQLVAQVVAAEAAGV